MASFGAKYPYFNPVAEEPEGQLPVYQDQDPVRVGRLVKADLTVNLASGKLFADDGLAESVDEFSSGSIAMETDDMEDPVAAVVYGCNVEGKMVRYNVGDDPPAGGLAYFKKLMRRKKVLCAPPLFPHIAPSQTRQITPINPHLIYIPRPEFSRKAERTPSGERSKEPRRRGRTWSEPIPPSPSPRSGHMKKAARAGRRRASSPPSGNRPRRSWRRSGIVAAAGPGELRSTSTSWRSGTTRTSSGSPGSFTISRSGKADREEAGAYGVV